MLKPDEPGLFECLPRAVQRADVDGQDGRSGLRIGHYATDATTNTRQAVDSHRLAAHFGTLTSEAESWPGAYGFRSSTGVPSKASIFSTSITLSLTEMILQRLRAIRFGRTGARQAKTPIGGLFLSPLGWI